MLILKDYELTVRVKHKNCSLWLCLCFSCCWFIKHIVNADRRLSLSQSTLPGVLLLLSGLPTGRRRGQTWPCRNQVTSVLVASIVFQPRHGWRGSLPCRHLACPFCLPGKLQLAICCISAAAGCLYNSTRKENPDTPASTQTFTYLPYLAIKATNQRQGLGGLAIKAMEYIILKGNTLHAFAILEKKYCIQSGAGWNMNTRCSMVLPSVRAFWL